MWIALQHNGQSVNMVPIHMGNDDFGKLYRIKSQDVHIVHQHIAIAAGVEKNGLVRAFQHAGKSPGSFQIVVQTFIVINGCQGDGPHVYPFQYEIF